MPVHGGNASTEHPPAEPDLLCVVVLAAYGDHLHRSDGRTMDTAPAARSLTGDRAQEDSQNPP
jgi:hypothetical protein